jgi:hypothetical protein
LSEPANNSRLAANEAYEGALFQGSAATWTPIRRNRLAKSGLSKKVKAKVHVAQWLLDIS